MPHTWGILFTEQELIMIDPYAIAGPCLLKKEQETWRSMMTNEENVRQIRFRCLEMALVSSTTEDNGDPSNVLKAATMYEQYILNGKKQENNNG
jgi:hypothetical protein